jgi:hypothetical protein
VWWLLVACGVAVSVLSSRLVGRIAVVAPELAAEAVH